jgi:hypothetical protein
MNEVEVDIAQTPCFVLSFRLSKGMVFLVVVVPQLGDDKDFFTLDEAFFDGTLDALSCFVLVLVVVGAVEETVADFDGLGNVRCLSSSSAIKVGNIRCRLCRQPAQLGLSIDRSLQGASHGQRRA